MYRRFADVCRRLGAGAWRLERPGFVLAIIFLISACGSAPDKAELSTPAIARATEISSDTASPPASSPQPPASSEIPIPPEAQQQFDSAVTAMSSGNIAGAEQTFRALSDTYPAYSGPLLNLAILQAKAGKLADAEKTLTTAIERNDSAAAFNQLGIVYRRLGRFKEADEAYQRAIQIDPDYALAHLNLGVLCDLYLQQPQRALEAYERYLALAATPDAKVAGWVTELKTRLGNQQRSAQAEQ